MRGSPLQGRRLRLLVPLLALVAAGALNATANAATTASGAQSATFGNANATVKFVGETKVTNFPGLPDPISNTPCPNQATDPINVVCEHFTVTATAAGTVSVCVQFDTGVALNMNDIDVFLVDDSTGVAVATAETTSNPECLSAQVKAGTFEIQVNPSFTPEGPTGVAGTVTFKPQPVGNPSCFRRYGKHMDGGGEDGKGGSFHGEGHQDDEHGDRNGKVEYRNDAQGYHFQSTRIDSVQFTQTGVSLLGVAIWKLTMTGAGVNNGQAVTFTVQMVDAGLNGLGDTFVISTSDGKAGGGQLTSGDNRYHDYGN